MVIEKRFFFFKFNPLKKSNPQLWPHPTPRDPDLNKLEFISHSMTRHQITFLNNLS